MKKLYFTSVTLLLFFLGRSQTTVSLTADRDNTIYSAFTANSNGAGEYLFVGRNAASNNNSLQRALVHFNTSTIPAGAVVTAASLTLYVDKVAPNATGMELHKVTTDWGEGTSNASGLEAQGATATNNDATWNVRIFPSTPWTINGGDFASTISASVASVAAAPVTLAGSGLLADVQSWIATPALNFGWILNSSNEALSASVKRIISRNSAVVAQRPVLSVTYTISLPVTLKSFSGSIANKQATLSWKTATEINNQYFSIEHSTNGIDYSPIGKVNGNGNSTTEHSYSFTHSNVSGGKHFYRLAQYDFNGNVKHSQVVVLSSGREAVLQISPNPATSFISVTASSSLEGSAFYIHSSAGQIIKKGSIKSQQIDIQALPAGQYWLNIETLSGETIRKIFVKR